MSHSKRIAVVLGVASSLVAASVGWGTALAGAAEPSASARIAFGMVGITDGQTAALSVVYIQVEPDIGDKNTEPDVGDKRNKRIVRLQFLDATDQVVAEREVELTPGHAESLDLAFMRSGTIDVGGRQQIRAMIIDGSIDDPNIRTRGTLLATLEVFDTQSGQTQFVILGRTVGIPPDTPDTPQDGRIAFGTVGITDGQTAALSVVYIQQEPDGSDKNIEPDVGDKRYKRIVRLQFFDAMDQVVAEREVQLSPGHAESLDLAFMRSGTTDVGGRQQIRAMIVDGSIDDPNIRTRGTLLATVEVFDTQSGHTRLALLPWMANSDRGQGDLAR